MNTEEQQRAAGKAVAARRVELGMSAAELARDAGIDPKTIRSLERGERWPWDKKRAAIEKALQWRFGALDDLRLGALPESLHHEEGTAMTGYSRWTSWQKEVAESVEIDGEHRYVDLSGLTIDARLHVLSQLLTNGRVPVDLTTAVQGQLIIQELAAVFARRIDETRRIHPDYHKPDGGLGLSPAQVDDANARGIALEDYADEAAMLREEWGEDESRVSQADFTRAAMAGTSELEQDDAVAARRGEESQDPGTDEPA